MAMEEEILLFISQEKSSGMFACAWDELHCNRLKKETSESNTQSAPASFKLRFDLHMNTGSNKTVPLLTTGLAGSRKCTGRSPFHYLLYLWTLFSLLFFSCITLSPRCSRCEQTLTQMCLTKALKTWIMERCHFKSCQAVNTCRASMKVCKMA